MRPKIETITPAKAKALLATNNQNRTLSKARINKYAGAMQRGEWQLNGQAIQVDKQGVLMNGQHRLHACIQANVSFKTLICYDVDRAVMTTLDVGRPRSLADNLKIGQYKNARLLGSSLKWVWKLTEGPTAIKGPLSPTHEQAIALLSTYGHLARSMELMNRAEFRPLTTGMARFIALHAVTYPQAPDQADAFAEKLVSGLGLTAATDPVKVLRDRLARERASTKKSPFYFPLVWEIKAWNAFRSGRQIRTLRYSHGEKIPRIKDGPTWPRT